ncbi:superinfection immunity protein [Nitrospirales bacterium NOB]|nr:superinfection immunity protein [Nitrospirales bacterium NOB]
MSEKEYAGLAYIGLSLILYFLPTIVASARSHHNTLAIFVLNLLTGWTILGWIIAIVWACTRAQPQQPIIIQQDFSDRHFQPTIDPPIRRPVILPQARLPDHLFDRKPEE